MLDERIRQKYKEIFALKEPLKNRPLKLICDKVFSAIMTLLMVPIFLFIALTHFLDGLIHPEHKGPLLASYVASTAGKEFMKYKFRIAKASFADAEAKKGVFYAPYHAQSDYKNLTCVGRVLKKYYLDELPQIFNILKGQMSFVGPRPLSWRDYEEDLKRGNVTRKLLKAGIFSETHVRKGTPDRYNLDLEYNYTKSYMKLPQILLLWADIKIILCGIKMILEGKGY